MNVKGNGGHAKVVRDIISFLERESDDWIIAVGNNHDRKYEAERLADKKFATLIHPKAYVADDVEFGVGTVVMAGAVVQPATVIGNHVIVNTCASVDHDCQIGDFVHIAPGARICGGVTIGEGAFLGAGCIVTHGVKVDAWSFHKAGSLVK